jgi:polyisoprenoid-binding protein YceI
MSTATATATATRIPNGAWSVDKVHSRVEFEVEHLGMADFRGSFRDYDARLVAGLTGISVEGSARVESVDVADENLEAHLLSPDFFDAERHPEIKFRSTAYELSDDGSVRVEGELTIRGKTVKVEATGVVGEPSVDPQGSNRIGVALQTTVDRHEFGLDWNADLANGKKALGDDVRLSVSLELVEATE